MQAALPVHRTQNLPSLNSTNLHPVLSFFPSLFGPTAQTAFLEHFRVENLTASLGSPCPPRLPQALRGNGPSLYVSSHFFSSPSGGVPAPAVRLEKPPPESGPPWLFISLRSFPPYQTWEVRKELGAFKGPRERARPCVARAAARTSASTPCACARKVACSSLLRRLRNPVVARASAGPVLYLRASVPFGPAHLGPAPAHRILSSSIPAASFPRRHDDDGVEQDLRAEARQVPAGGRRRVLHDRLRGSPRRVLGLPQGSGLRARARSGPVLPVCAPPFIAEAGACSRLGRGLVGVAGP